MGMSGAGVGSSGRRSASGGALLLAILFLGYAVYALDRTVLTSMISTVAKSLNLDSTQLGLLTSAVYIGVLATVFAAGHLSDRYGARKIIIVGVSIFTAFTWLIGFSTNFYEAFTFRLISGLGEGIFWPVAMSAVANYFGMNKGRALGIFYVGFDAGSAIGSSVGGTTLSLTSDWHYAFFVAPLIGIAVVAGAFFAKGTFDEANGKVGSIAMGKDVLDLLKRRQVVVMMAFALLATWASSWQVNYLSYYFSGVKGLSAPLAAFVMSPVAISGGVGKVLLGNASDRWRRNRMLVVLSAAVVALYAMFFSASNIYVSTAIVLAIGFTSSAVFPIMQSLMCDSCDGRTGSALGLTTTAQSVATVLAPNTTAQMLAAFGKAGAIAYNTVIPAALAVCVALLLKDAWRERPRPQA
jgi:predicted MFS family arabinose efflux permease